MRVTAIALLAMISAATVFLGVATPLLLMGQAKQDLDYYRAFQSAAGSAIAEEEGQGRSPADRLLVHPSWPAPVDRIDLTTSASTLCDASFKPAPTDRFILSFWRGEWAECYGYPSGRTTLSRSVGAYLRSGLGVQVALYWLVAAVSACAAYLLWRRRGLVGVTG